MDKKYLESLQKFIVYILKKDNHKKTLSALANGNCSEVARILGLKILNDLGEPSKPFILKGEVTVRGFNSENKHDILGFYNSHSRRYILIDPTIWQFFPKKRKIYLGEFSSIEDAIKYAEGLYKGVWKFSEYIERPMEKEVSKWKKIIKLNCDEA